jgi:hypothetical protein
MMYVTWSLSHFNMRAIWKVTSSEPLKKQAMRKRILLYTKNKYMSYFSA